jgi:hypothetical protein
MARIPPAYAGVVPLVKFVANVEEFYHDALSG